MNYRIPSKYIRGPFVVSLLIIGLVMACAIAPSAYAQDVRCAQCNMRITGSMDTAEINQGNAANIYCNIICALMDAVEIKDCTINASCAQSGDPIEIIYTGGSAASVNPTTSLVLYSGMHVQNKIFSSPANADAFIAANSWASIGELKTVHQTVAGLTSESGICPTCSTQLSGIQSRLVYKNGDEELFCCTSCAFYEYNQNPESVEEVYVMEFLNGTLINGEEAYYVEGYIADSPCCKNAFIPFALEDEARDYLFTYGGRVVDINGVQQMDIEEAKSHANPFIWLGLGIAALIGYILFAFNDKIFKKKGDGEELPAEPKDVKRKRMIKMALAILVTIGLITSLALTWRPSYFTHKVFRLAIDDDGNRTVVGQVEEVFLAPSDKGHYVVGFHFFNIMMGEAPVSIRLDVWGDADFDLTLYPLDGDKFNDETSTRENVQFGHSFNLDFAFDTDAEEFIGGMTFYDYDTGEILVTLPIYVMEGTGSVAGGGCCG